MIKNNGILPLDKNTKIALYGAGAKYTVKGGTGSGDVNNRNNISVYKGLENAGFYIENEEWLREYDKIYEDTKRAWINKIYEIAGKEDFRKLSKAYSENPMPLPKAPKISGKATAEVAIYVISRISGEGADRHREKGDYYLSDEEMQNIRDISNSYKHLIIVLNVGGIMDLSFMEEVSIDALILLSQAGMEGGNAFADVITGAVNPSGCLTDTWSYRYEDYPSSENFSHNNGNLIEELYSEGIYVGYRYFDSFKIKPRYAFGYGLSYTTFDIKVKKVYKKNGNIYTCLLYTSEAETV